MHYLLAADIDRKIDAQNRYPYIPEAGDNVLSLFQCEKHEPLSPRPPYVLSSQRCYDVCKTQILMTRRVWQPLLVTDAPPLMRSTYSLRAGPITLKGHSTIHAVSTSLCHTNLVYFPKCRALRLGNEFQNRNILCEMVSFVLWSIVTG